MKTDPPGGRRPEFLLPAVKKAKHFAIDGENSQQFCLRRGKKLKISHPVMKAVKFFASSSKNILPPGMKVAEN
jgi:hypothetical protein